MKTNKFTFEQIEAGAKSLGFKDADSMYEHFKLRLMDGGLYEQIRALVIHERTQKAAELGKEAFDKGLKAVPALDKNLAPLLKGLQVCEGLPILKAWNKGFHAANAAAPVPGITGNLYLVEYYRKHPGTGETGFEIRFAWIGAANSDEARSKVKLLPFFDVVIQCEQQAEIFALAGVDPADLRFVDTKHWETTKQAVWAKIAGKAFMYKTAKLGEDYVAILSVIAPGTFAIRHSSRGVISVDCNELTNFCL